jgi:hypothetical protein
MVIIEGIWNLLQNSNIESMERNPESKVEDPEYRHENAKSEELVIW